MTMPASAQTICPNGTYQFPTPYGAGFICSTHHAGASGTFCPSGYVLQFFQTPIGPAPACVELAPSANANGIDNANLNASGGIDNQAENSQGNAYGRFK